MFTFWYFSLSFVFFSWSRCQLTDTCHHSQRNTRREIFYFFLNTHETRHNLERIPTGVGSLKDGIIIFLFYFFTPLFFFFSRVTQDLITYSFVINWTSLLSTCSLILFLYYLWRRKKRKFQRDLHALSLSFRESKHWEKRKPTRFQSTFNGSFLNSKEDPAGCGALQVHSRQASDTWSLSVHPSCVPFSLSFSETKVSSLHLSSAQRELRDVLSSHSTGYAQLSRVIFFLLH